MKLNIYSFLCATSAVMVLAGCEKESGFLFNDGEGQLNCRSLTVDYINSGRQVRAGGIDTGDFTVNFVNADNVVVKNYLYSEMPEVVALPVGEYTINAQYGDNPVSEWEAPYYFGESKSSFSIKAGEITDDVDPVECSLSNIKISVNIDDMGLGILGEDAKVVVRAGNKGELTFDKSKQGVAGYFRYVANSNSITATFSGTVDGVYIEGVTKAYDNANAGNAYTINFTVSKPDNAEPGDIQVGDGDNTGIDIDATIAIQDENKVIDPNEPDDNILIDDMRPTQDPDNNGDNQGGNQGSGNDNQGGNQSGDDNKGPKVQGLSDGLVLNGSVDIDSISEFAFDVVSNTGITAFNIHIESNSLSPEELAGVGLAADIDLINPGALGEPLSGLGFPVGDQVENQKSCHFDITMFLNLLAALGPDEHKFHLTVTDAEGTTECYIGLIQKY